MRILKILPFLLPIFVPISTIALSEFILATAQKKLPGGFEKTYLRNKVDRAKLLYPDFQPLNRDDQRKRVAVFGGSSAFGWGSEGSFSEILSQKLSNDLIVHNYAKVGNPFVGYQSEKLKAIMKYYDYFIIYAGHNELYGYIYSDFLKNNKEFVYPNGRAVSQKELVEYDLVNKRDMSLAIERQKNNPNIFAKLRTPTFLRHSIAKILNLKNKKASFEPKRYPFFSKYEYVIDRNLIINKFDNEIKNISKLLNDKQKLFLVTIISNDIYPPLLGSIDNANSNDFDKTTEIVSKSYFNLVNQKDMPYSLLNIKDNIHKDYLLTMYKCKKDSPITNFDLDKVCLDSFKRIKGQDRIPIRFLNEINSSILKKKNYQDNVYVIDFESKFLSKIKNSKDYFSYFVDIAHPSLKGHNLIAESLIPYLSKGSIEDFVITKAKCELAQERNISWLEAHIKFASVTFFYDYHLKEVKSVDCNKFLL